MFSKVSLRGGNQGSLRDRHCVCVDTPLGTTSPLEIKGVRPKNRSSREGGVNEVCGSHNVHLALLPSLLPRGLCPASLGVASRDSLNTVSTGTDGDSNDPNKVCVCVIPRRLPPPKLFFFMFFPQDPPRPENSASLSPVFTLATPLVSPLFSLALGSKCEHGTALFPSRPP